LDLDFNLLKTVQTDSNAQVTGSVAPVVVSPATASGGSELGEELHDLKGPWREKIRKR
jgi:hypothetical protein